MSTEPMWSMAHWIKVVEHPGIVDEALGRDHPHAGVALLTLALHHHDPDVVLSRVKAGMTSTNPQTRANALQSLGHHARLRGTLDREAIGLLRRALRDRTVSQGYQVRGYAANAAGDVGMFVTRGELPRWLRRRFAGPRRTPATRRRWLCSADG